MTAEQIIAVFGKNFASEAELDGAIKMLVALLNKQVASAKIGIASAQASQAAQVAEGIRQAAQIEANAADEAFAKLVAAAAAA